MQEKKLPLEYHTLVTSECWTSSNKFSNEVMNVIKTILEMDHSPNHILSQEYYEVHGTYEGLEEYLKKR